MQYTPEELAQGQLDAYNNHDIEKFLTWYSEDIEGYNFPNDLIFKGREKMRERYAAIFTQNPMQHAHLGNRMCLKNTVIDYEHITGRANGIESEVIAIYQIENNKIARVYFVRE